MSIASRDLPADSHESFGDDLPLPPDDLESHPAPSKANNRSGPQQVRRSADGRPVRKPTAGAVRSLRFRGALRRVRVILSFL